MNVLGGVWCRGFMSWGDTLILVISRGVQLYHGIAQISFFNSLRKRVGIWEILLTNEKY